MKKPKNQTTWKPTKINEEKLIEDIKKFILKEAEKKTKIFKKNNYEELIDMFVDIYTD